MCPDTVSRTRCLTLTRFRIFVPARQRLLVVQNLVTHLLFTLKIFPNTEPIPPDTQAAHSRKRASGWDNASIALERLYICMWTLCFLPMVQALSLSPKLTWRERIKAQRHIRPHVNPLQRRFQVRPDLEALAAQLDFEDPSLPLHIDVGCGKGHFCADLAEARRDINVLGIEIREALVDEARRLCVLSGVPNLKFLAGSANILVGPCCDALLPHSRLCSASINFPDPWPKRAHRKRRVCQPDLVRALAERLNVDAAETSDRGFVLVQSDVPELAEEMRATFLESGLFEDNTTEETTVFAFGPVTIQTERERQAARRGTPVTRFCLVRAGAAAR